MAIVADIDRDDQNEVVICYSNKYVRIFRFKHFQRLGIGMLKRSEIQANYHLTTYFDKLKANEAQPPGKSALATGH